jgi:hypothetical protein
LTLAIKPGYGGGAVVAGRSGQSMTPGGKFELIQFLSFRDTFRSRVVGGDTNGP